jgi:hypothetical protein
MLNVFTVVPCFSQVLTSCFFFWGGGGFNYSQIFAFRGRSWNLKREMIVLSPGRFFLQYVIHLRCVICNTGPVEFLLFSYFTHIVTHSRFCWAYCRERDHLEDLGVDGRIILKLIFKKWDWRM